MHCALACADQAGQQDQGVLYLQGTPSAEQQQEHAAFPPRTSEEDQESDLPDADPATSAPPHPHAEVNPPANEHATSASGMSLQPPSLPAAFSEVRQQSQAQLVAQAQQQAAGGSPREGGGDLKQAAPKPPLAPGSKTAPQVPTLHLFSDLNWQSDQVHGYV